MSDTRAIKTFLEDHAGVASVRLTRVRGSSPRDAGAEMFVAKGAVFGTIGGGQLEYMAISQARALLAQGANKMDMDVPLGPEIGQCCGGRVEISLARMSVADKVMAVGSLAGEVSNYPSVYIIGAGHVGRALAASLALLPVKTILIDGRTDELSQCKSAVEKCLTPLAEAEIRAAPAGSAFVVLTHDHSLDFLAASEALARGDAAYVGMIGSASKRASFKSWCRRENDGQSINNLTCPIGAGSCSDKRPEVIAALVAAEVITELTGFKAREAAEKPSVLLEGRSS